MMDQDNADLLKQARQSAYRRAAHRLRQIAHSERAKGADDYYEFSRAAEVVDDMAQEEAQAAVDAERQRAEQAEAERDSEERWANQYKEERDEARRSAAALEKVTRNIEAIPDWDSSSGAMKGKALAELDAAVRQLAEEASE